MQPSSVSRSIKMFRFILLVLASSTAIAVLDSATSMAADNQNNVERNAHPVISQLELRNRKVTITTSPQGSLYSIADESGMLLSAALTEDRLAEEYPELYELLQPAIANQDAELMMLVPWNLQP